MTFAISLFFAIGTLMGTFVIAATLWQYAPRMVEIIDQYARLTADSDLILSTRKVSGRFHAQPVPVIGPAPTPMPRRQFTAKIIELPRVSVQAFASPVLSDIPEAA